MDVEILPLENIAVATVGVNDLFTVYRCCFLVSGFHVYLGFKPPEVVVGVFVPDVSGAVGDLGYVAGGIVFVPHEDVVE